MDAARVSFKARRRADTVAPPPRFDPIKGSVAGAVIAGSVFAVFYWLAGGNHIAGPIGVITILAFALPYLHLRRKERKNSEAFDTYYIRLLELERAREKSSPAVKPSTAPGKPSSRLAPLPLHPDRDIRQQVNDRDGTRSEYDPYS